MYVKDTIAAISTPPGQGGIGIVRVSGDMAPVIAATLFKPVRNGGFESHRFYFGAIVDFESSEVVDEAMAVLMRAPASYTREDVLELQCHGGSLVVERVLALTLRAGARLADPGEFTKRAFLNGRIDLIQAESVMDIIEARTDAALRLAQRQRSGALSRRIEDIRAMLLKALALTEAYIDFPEDDLGETDVATILELADNASVAVDNLIAGYDEGRVLRDGISVLIIGKPNAGKSSLLNRLLNENRAIVTHLPGTTRDIIEETINLGGLAVRLLDTAGIRHTQDIIEQEGINRALDKIEQADLVLFVLDGSRPFDHEDKLIYDSLRGKNIIAVINKTDLRRLIAIPPELGDLDFMDISAESGMGVEQLKEAVKLRFVSSRIGDSRDFVAVSHARHRDVLCSTSSCLSRFKQGLQMSVSLEFLAIELREALTTIGAITGQAGNEEVLELIFSSFCIGK